MLATVQYRSKLARDAGESMKAFQKAYDAISDIDRLPKDQQRLLREGMIRYAEFKNKAGDTAEARRICLLYTSPSPRDRTRSRMPSSA